MRKVIFIIALIVFIVSGVYVVKYFLERSESNNIINKANDIFYNPQTDEKTGFDALFDINPDIKGWIKINDTDVSFPVVQAKDNDKYLRTNFFLKYDYYGTPFIDYRCKAEPDYMSANTIIYGHNIRGISGAVFAPVTKYNNLDFYKNHPTIEFNTIYKDMEWKIIGAFVANTLPEHGEVFEYQNFIESNVNGEFNDFVAEVKKRSIIDTPVDVNPGDKLLTLSTCIYDFDEARFVVVARKVRDGEDKTVDTSQAKLNPNPLYPDIWYQKKGIQKPES